MIDNILFIISSYFIAIVATLAGFGSSTLLIPVAMLFMDIKTAIFIVACFHLFNNIFKVRAFWDSIEYHTFLQFGIPSIVFAFFGARLIAELSVDTLQVVMGIFFICLSLYSFFNKNFFINKSIGTSIIGGGLSGLLAGLIGLGGAIRSMFLICYQLRKEAYIATAAAIALIVDLTRIPTYLIGNVVQDTSYFALLPLLVVSAYLGVRTGKSILHKISQQAFRKIVLIALLLVGLKLLYYSSSL